MPYYTFAEDVAASGGYWLLCTGHKVYANQSSIVGSIGVISMQLAVKGWLDRNNIERTAITTSENLLEYRLDPLRHVQLPQENIDYTNSIQASIFEEFKSHVLQHRKFNDQHLEQVFSADVVTGLKAKDIGLVDEIGMVEEVMDKEFSGSKIVDFSKTSKLEQLQ